MTQICPTVTAFDVASFEEQFRLVTSFAQRIHIDLMDGDFTATQSPSLVDVAIETATVVDVHVMYRRPQDIIDDLIALRPHLVIIHAESEVDIPLFAAEMRQHNIKTGIGLLPETSVEDVAHLLSHVQHLLVFGGHLGYHGGSADISQLHKVMDAKGQTRYLEYGWDGGANLQNAVLIKQAGINVINVGGCIHKAEDPLERYRELVQLIT